MLRITLRSAVKSDIEQIVPMVEKFYANSELYNHIEFDPASVKSFLSRLIQDSDGDVLVAQHDKQIVGMASFAVVPAVLNPHQKIWQGINLYVNPEYRKYGLGRRLYDAAEYLGVQMGCSVFLVETPFKDCEAIEALHESNGYKPFQKQFYKAVN